MKVIVCGGGDYAFMSSVFEALDNIHDKVGITELAHGDANGVDKLSGEWAAKNNVGCTAYPANWKQLGNAAGISRNQRMLVEFKPDMVIAFHGGRGTADMVARAEREGVKIFTVLP